MLCNQTIEATNMKEKKSVERWYSVREAGIRLKHGDLIDGKPGFSHEHVYDLIHAGQLKSVIIGGCRLIYESHIRAYEMLTGKRDFPEPS